MSEQDFADLMREILIGFVEVMSKEFCIETPLAYINITKEGSIQFSGDDPRLFRENIRAQKRRLGTLEDGISQLITLAGNLENWNKRALPVEHGATFFGRILSCLNCSLADNRGDQINPLALVIWEALSRRIVKKRARKKSP